MKNKLACFAILVSLFMPASWDKGHSVRIDLRDFFVYGDVEVARNGKWAVLLESPEFYVEPPEEDPSYPYTVNAALSSDPAYGDPEILLTSDLRSVHFGYWFCQGPNEDDALYAFIFNPYAGLGQEGSYERPFQEVRITEPGYGTMT